MYYQTDEERALMIFHEMLCGARGTRVWSITEQAVAARFEARAANAERIFDRAYIQAHLHRFAHEEGYSLEMDADKATFTAARPITLRDVGYAVAAMHSARKKLDEALAEVERLRARYTELSLPDQDRAADLL